MGERKVRPRARLARRAAACKPRTAPAARPQRPAPPAPPALAWRRVPGARLEGAGAPAFSACTCRRRLTAVPPQVLNKYYPPDFDPELLPRNKKPRDRQIEVRIMIPFTLCCSTCKEFSYRGKKFNSKKEIAQDIDYLGLHIHRS